MAVHFLALVATSALLTPQPAPKQGCTRRAALLQTSLLSSSILLAPPAARAESDDVVMQGVLQMTANDAARVPSGSTATVVIRVVGRNTKGPLATVQVPLNGKTFPVEYSIVRADLREGVPDFLWQAEDIYVKADLTTPSGKDFAAGRSKAKAVTGADGQPSHKVAYLTLE